MSDFEMVEVEEIPVNDSIVDITVVLDRSGSMACIADDTIGGFNTFVKSQQEQGGVTKLTLVQFDSQYEVVHDAIEIDSVSELTLETFVPRGSTALLDAIGRRVTETRVRIEGLPEDEKPDTVIFVIITDGHENSSREFKREQVKSLIQDCEDNLEWDIVYLGANQDAWAVAEAMGIKGGKALSYSYTGEGATRAFESIAVNTNSLRGSKLAPGVLGREEFNFTAEDIKAQAELDPTIAKTDDNG